MNSTHTAYLRKRAEAKLAWYIYRSIVGSPEAKIKNCEAGEWRGSGIIVMGCPGMLQCVVLVSAKTSPGKISTLLAERSHPHGNFSPEA
jgi:hypothetical protein